MKSSDLACAFFRTRHDNEDNDYLMCLRIPGYKNSGPLFCAKHSRQITYHHSFRLIPWYPEDYA